MALSPLAGKPAPEDILIDVTALERAYYERQPDPENATQRVAFGTSGHRGTPGAASFTEAHILAITQAICDYRAQKGTTGPLFMGKDTHALSAPAQRTALEVLAANGVQTVIQPDGGFTPTPVISRAILVYNRGRTEALGDGIVITPSHNPPEDGGFKYNPPDGGPADTDVTKWVQDRANDLLRGGQPRREAGHARAGDAGGDHARRGHDGPLCPGPADGRGHRRHQGRRAVAWRRPAGRCLAARTGSAVNAIYGLGIDIVNTKVDPRFAFMTVDHDGKIRMDCSSPYAMASLLGLKDQYRVAFANDPDSDRHGIVTHSGLMNPNHYLAVAIRYLLRNRPHWPTSAVVGKTLVSSDMIDRVVARRSDAPLSEVPVGFKWFAPGLFDGTCCFGGEESAGASFLRRDGSVWSTDKDGIILDLLAAEITATTGRDPGEHYRELTARFGTPFYTRIDAAGHARAEGAARQALARGGDRRRRSRASRSPRS